MLKKIISLIVFIATMPAFAMCENGIDTSFVESKTSVEILCKKRFTVGYSSNLRSPLWTIEILKRDDLLKPEFKRPSNFRKDPSVSKKDQLTTSSCNSMGFDRGHLVAFENIADDETSIAESFYLTNVVCQYPKHNRTIWKSLESTVRKIAEKSGKIIVITGVTYDEKSQRTNSIPIPSFMWKVIFTPTSDTPIIYLIPHTMDNFAKLESYVVSPTEFRMKNGHLNLIKMPVLSSINR